jgi:hypothetical protein
LGYKKPVVIINSAPQFNWHTGTIDIKKVSSDDVVLRGLRMGVTRMDCEYSTIYDSLVILEAHHHLVIKDIHYNFYNMIYCHIKELEAKLSTVSGICSIAMESIQRTKEVICTIQRCNNIVFQKCSNGDQYGRWLQEAKLLLEECYKDGEAKFNVAKTNAEIASVRF